MSVAFMMPLALQLRDVSGSTLWTSWCMSSDEKHKQSNVACLHRKQCVRSVAIEGRYKGKAPP